MPLAIRLVVPTLLGLWIAGCAVIPRPLSDSDRDHLAADSQSRLFDGQEPLLRPLSLAEATARAIKHQADYRLRQMEAAAAMAQLDVARFDLLPRLMANAGYTTRSNDAFGFGFSPGGAIAVNPSASVERSHDTASVGFAWNILDFGLGYYRAKQLADQHLILEERRRRAVQSVVHDVRVAWWRAEAAQRLLPAADDLLDEVEQAIEKTRVVEARKLLPPIQTANLRRALFDLAQQITFRRQEIAQAKVDLAALVNSPPGSDLKVEAPPSTDRQVFDFTADVDRLEVAALRNRPELAEEGYRPRITEAEARKGLVGLLPGLSLDLGLNFDGNKFLVNSTWASAGVNVAFNLIKAFSLPALKRSGEAQVRVDEARRLAMAIAILTQTRIAAVRYTLMAEEFRIWDEAARDDKLIVQYLGSSAEVGTDTELELIRAKARAMASQINRDIAYVNVEASVARLYNSVGYDTVPHDAEGHALDELTRMIAVRFADLKKQSFTPRITAPMRSVAIGAVGGVDAAPARQISAGVDRVLKLSGIRQAKRSVADLSLDISVTAQPPKEGARAVRVAVRVTNSQSGAAALPPAEFKTTLSEPIDDEQWRVLGEGAAYLVGSGITKPLGRRATARRTGSAVRAPAKLRLNDMNLDGGTLVLRLEPELQLVRPRNPLRLMTYESAR